MHYKIHCYTQIGFISLFFYIAYGIKILENIMHCIVNILNEIAVILMLFVKIFINSTGYIITL